MGKYEALAKEIIKNVGGENNIKSLTHCITRLRFKLKDESIANDESIKSLEGVATLIKSAGQYQVVIGNHVAEVYSDINSIFKIENNNTEENTKKGSLFSRAIDTISGILQPLLGAMSACGVLKGFNALFVALGFYDNQSGNYILMNAIGDALYMFFPLFLGYTSAQKFNIKPTTGLAIGAAMCYPTIQLNTLANSKEIVHTLFANTMFASNIYLDFLGVPIISMNYTSTVIPVIFVVYFASKCDKLFNKIIPDVVKFFVVPMLTIFVSVALGFIIIGPFITFASLIVSKIIFAIRDFSPLVSGIIIGGTWQALVIFGMHWALLPVHFTNIITLGYDTLITPYFSSTFAIVGILLAIFIKAKDKKTKEITFPGLISSIFGVTEPAIYGVLLPLKKPFIIQCIVSGIVGGFLGHYNLQKYFIGGLGVFAFPGMINPDGSNENIIIAILGAIIAVILGFIITLFTCKTEENIENKTNKKEDSTTTLLDKENILSPLKGKVLKLSECSDDAFSSETLGKGVLIIPEEGKVLSPINGTVTTITTTMHAIGITSDNGTEILIHVGMDTVKLNGKYFKSDLKEGDKISIGDCLLEFEKENIIKEGYSIETAIVVLNTDKFLDILEINNNDYVNYNDSLLTVIN